MNIQNWIWTDQTYDATKPVVVFFRKTFDLDTLPLEDCYVRVSADTRYRFYVNGHFVCMGPRRGDDKVWYYERVNIRRYLQKGQNVFCAAVLRYPPIPYQGFRSAYRTATAGLMVYGEDERIPSTDTTWKCLVADKLQVGCKMREYIRLYQEETVEGNLLFRDWKKESFDDSNWSEAVTYPKNILSRSVSPLYLKERTIPLLYETRKRFAGVNHIVTSALTKEQYEGMLKGEGSVTIPPHAHEVIDLRAEELTTAYLELSVLKGKGAVIRITESEAYSKETTIHNMPAFVKADRLDASWGELRGPVDEYHVAGYGKEEEPEYYEPFSFREFYLIRLEIETAEEELILKSFIYRETAYPLTAVSHVDTSDPEYADIWKISERTLRMCMHETYEDCPGYEQLQYAMDTRSQILFNYCLSADDRLARQAIDDFSRSQRPDGLIAACYPTFKSNIIPSFSAYYVMMIHDHMMYFGDKAFLKHYFPSVMRVCNFFLEHINEKGLVGTIENMGYLNKAYWGYIDSIDGWIMGVPPIPEGKEIIPLSLLTLSLLHAAEEVASYIGYKSQAEEYALAQKNMKEGLRKCCLGANGLIQDAPGEEMYSEFGQIFATLNGVFTEEEAKRAMRHTLDGSLVKCSLPLTLYQFRALEKAGLYAEGREIFTRWENMLKKNLSTCVEHDFEDQQRSDCHAWSSVPLYEITSAILGVSPASPGYASVRFNPHMLGLSYAKGEIATHRGIIQAEWKCVDGKPEKTIEVPEGMQIAE